MNTQQEIEKLQNELKSLQAKQSNCKHEWNKPIYDPETVKEGYGMHSVAHGSDIYPEYTGYHDVQKDRWSRECSICGKKEYSYKKEPVISGYEPKF